MFHSNYFSISYMLTATYNKETGYKDSLFIQIYIIYIVKTRLTNGTFHVYFQFIHMINKQHTNQALHFHKCRHEAGRLYAVGTGHQLPALPYNNSSCPILALKSFYTFFYPLFRFYIVTLRLTNKTI